jgi:hypothetical protein
MNHRPWSWWIGLLWVALPAVALRHWQVWKRLPARLATHFDAAGHANGWMSPVESLTLSLALLIFVLAVTTGILARVREPDAAAWSSLGAFYGVVGTVIYGESAILDYNLGGKAMPRFPLIVPMVIAVAAASLLAKRGAPLPPLGRTTEEVHASPLWAAALLLPGVAELVAAAVTRAGLAQAAFGTGGAVWLLAAAAAGSGFHYCFSDAGVDIRVLGLRLRSIPAANIKHYAAGRRNPRCGYGIRGIGRRCGYVWGSRGVRVDTGDGEVFLGHDQPERIVRDLDVVKQFASGG